MRPIPSLAASLFVGASVLALAGSAQAGRILFSTADGAATSRAAELPVGPVELSGGLTQIQTDDGGVVSFIGAARFSVGEGGAITVQTGQFTATAGTGAIQVGLPGGGVATISSGGAGSFSVAPDGAVAGRALAGGASLTSGGVTRSFPVGQAFHAAAAAAAQAAVTAGVQTVSTPQPGALIDQPTTMAQVLQNAALIVANVGATGVPVVQNPLLVQAPDGAPAELLAFLLNQAPSGEAPVFTQASSQLLAAQLAYLQGGGEPGAFDAQTAATVAQAYARFLASGGAATAFTGADASQVQAYLAYLNQPGVLDAVDAATRAQLAAYRSLLASHADSLSSAAVAQSLAAYIAFLKAGGIDSTYAGASQALLQSYLSYLQAFGVPSGLDGATAQLVTDYLAYLNGGGAFGTVPVSTTPTSPPAPDPGTTQPVDPTPPAGPTPTPPDPTPPTPPATSLGSGPTKLATAAAGLYSGGPADPGLPTVTLDANGRPSNLGYYGAPGTAQLTDVKTGSGWLIGRYANGTFGSGVQQTYGPNTGVHFVVQTPVSAIPASGTLFYNLAAFTPPTRADGLAVTASAVDFSLGVTYGSAPKFGFNGLVSLDGESFGFASVGGAAAPSLTNVYAPTGELDLYGAAPLTSVIGSLCSATTACSIRVNFAAGGAGAATFGGAYGLIDKATSNAKVIGAVLLTRASTPGTAGVGGGGAGGGGTGSATTTTAMAPASGASLSFTAQGPALNRSAVTGAIVADAAAATLASARTTANNTAVRNTAVDADNGGVAGIVGWTRWTSGTAVLNDGTSTTLTANQGVHLAWGAPLTNMPTTGTATYALAGATRPTFSDGSAAPGTFTGQLGVAFASLKVGWDATVAIGGQSYAFNSSGGSAAPSVTLGADGRWIGSSTPAGGYAGRSYGFLAGDGASHAGMSYFLTQTTGANPLTITGAAAFAKK